MAHTRNNAITKTYSGKFGNICMQKDGVIRSLPDLSNRVFSEKQKRQLSRFELAKAYGRQVVADARLSAMYSGPLERWKKKAGKKNMGVYQMAIMDYLHAPKIISVELDKGHGSTVWVIRIVATDSLPVAGVAVSIVAPGGVTVEEGLAAGLHRFEYHIKNPSSLRPGTIVRVSAWDVPGNVTEKEFDCYC